MTRRRHYHSGPGFGLSPRSKLSSIGRSTLQQPLDLTWNFDSSLTKAKDMPVQKTPAKPTSENLLLGKTFDADGHAVLAHMTGFILKHYGRRHRSCHVQDCPTCAMWKVYDDAGELMDL